MRTTARGLPTILLAALLGTAAALADRDSVQAAVDHPDRVSSDRDQDATRKPVELLSFAGLAPGMAVADLMAGSGWYTELLSHLVGEEGRVYAQNNEISERRYGFRLRSRVNRPVPLSWVMGPRLSNVTLVENELETLEDLPDASLDAVLMIQFFHDTYWMGVDRKAMLARVLAVLKPGGSFLVVDHEAGEGRGATQAERLHRVEAGQVESEVLAAGFALAGRSDALRNPSDDRSRNVFEEGVRGRTDRFALRFEKPAP